MKDFSRFPLNKQLLLGFVSLYLYALVPLGAHAQEKPSLSDFALFIDDLSEPTFTNFVVPKIEGSQFMLLGESHGIVEAGTITNHLYNLGKPFGFKTLCIETDPLVAQTISDFHKRENALEEAGKLERKYPFSIPFYNNYEDYGLFKNVFADGGVLWGIDQSLMAQFRLSFDHLIQTTQNPHLRASLERELTKAEESYRLAVEEKDFMAAYIFQYTKEVYERLMSHAQKSDERKILEDLWKSKEIYDHQFAGEYYLNNHTRGQLMKANFMSYYKEGMPDVAYPKVLFKLGYNHAAKGLTFTDIYDIGNMASELAISNGFRSLHIAAMGVSGYENRANPVEPGKVRQKIDYSRYLPPEFLDLAKGSAKKYVLLDLEKMRPVAHKFGGQVKELVFKFDLYILINDAQPVTSFGE